jgi:hypothetical protein
MSEWESFAAPVLKPVLRGRASTLDGEAQAVVRAWIVLRCMILERGGAAPGAKHFYTNEERRAFANIGRDTPIELVDGTYIWVYQHRRSQWIARSNVANAGLHTVRGGPPTNQVQIITAQISHFGFQVLVGRWPKGQRLNRDSRGVTAFADAMCVLWPDPPPILEWPANNFYLSDAAYEPLLDRFIKPGFPLEPRRGRQ